MSILDTIARHSDNSYNSRGTEHYDAKQKMSHSPEYRRQYHLYHYQACIKRQKRYRQRHAKQISAWHHQYYLKHRTHIIAREKRRHRIRHYNHKY